MSLWLPLPPTFVAALSLLATSALLPQISAQEEDAKDPWFTTSIKMKSTGDGEDEQSVNLRTKNPNALAKHLRKVLADIPDANLTKRISTLEEIISLVPQKAQAEQEEAKRLRIEKSKTLESIELAGSGKLTIESSIQQLGPYSHYLRGDTSLLFQLLQTPLIDRIDARVRFLGRENDRESLAELDQLITANGLKPILGSRVNYAASDSITDTFLQQWKSLINEETLLPGEAFLLGQLLGNDELKLRVGLAIVSTADPRLVSNITRSMENDWGKKLEFIPTTRRIDAAHDLNLTIETEDILASLYETSSNAESIIPGAVTEEPNPDFLDLVEEFEKAAKGYETSLKNYEMQYDHYLTQFEDDDYNRAQQQLGTAQDRLAATPQTDETGNTTQEYEAARAELQIAQSLANSVSPTTIPEPVKPYPAHLEILEELHLVPSTIITSEEKTPYEYTSKKLEYTFNTHAKLKLEAPIPNIEQSSTEVSLKQLRDWTRNEGIDPRDPIVDEGSFSQGEYNSALDLFSLEFGSRCSKEFKKLITDTAKTIDDATSPGLPQAVLSIALDYASSNKRPRTLNREELSKLTEKVNTEHMPLNELRATYLSIILHDSPYASLADKESIAAAL